MYQQSSTYNIPCNILFYRCLSCFGEYCNPCSEPHSTHHTEDAVGVPKTLMGTRFLDESGDITHKGMKAIMLLAIIHGQYNEHKIWFILTYRLGLGTCVLSGQGLTRLTLAVVTQCRVPTGP